METVEKSLDRDELKALYQESIAAWQPAITASRFQFREAKEGEKAQVVFLSWLKFVRDAFGYTQPYNVNNVPSGGIRESCTVRLNIARRDRSRTQKLRVIKHELGHVFFANGDGLATEVGDIMHTAPGSNVSLADESTIILVYSKKRNTPE